MIRGMDFVYVDVAVVMNGYYETNHRILVNNPASLESVDAHRIRLLERIDPIPMLAKRVVSISPDREAGEPYAFDLVRGDFVSPFGEGVERNIELAYVRKFKSDRVRQGRARGGSDSLKREKMPETPSKGILNKFARHSRIDPTEPRPRLENHRYD